MENIKDIRLQWGISQADFSKILGVSISSLRRWEAGSEPSALAKQRIKQLKNSDVNTLLANLKKGENNISDSEQNFATFFEHKGIKYPAQYMPYIINGPSDQREFYSKLLRMQEQTNYSGDTEKYLQRISLLQKISETTTSHFLIESPKATAKSWSSDYGTHCFHRYVGRFPAALIRALINYFGADTKDIILDPFCGSGTTLAEARMLGISSIGIEISPLSAMISRTKSQYPRSPFIITALISQLEKFYTQKWNEFTESCSWKKATVDAILARRGNSIPKFSNIERWMSKEALLGTSIVVEFINSFQGYEKDFLCVALSAKMRSIGNVDVDVVRAEYRKTPRENVDVLRLIKCQLQKMAKAINDVIKTHPQSSNSCVEATVLEGSVLKTKIPPESISHIITSPPYGVESLSYLRTHLLSFRVLESILGVDPYSAGNDIIGSEYISSKSIKSPEDIVSKISTEYKTFFDVISQNSSSAQKKARIVMMRSFFEDMYNVIKNFSIWLKNDGMVAFIIGNKKIGDAIIPTDKIIKEIFAYWGFKYIDSIAHKLKTNNSNSKVPWQERIIENEYVLIFKKEKKQ